MVTDSISDMFNQIMNAQAVDQPVVWLSHAKMNFALAKILKDRHYLKGIKKRGLGVKARMGLVLQYFDDQPAVSGFKRMSKPGCRIYTSAQKIERGKGLLILSTSHGLMEREEAKRKGLGGEVIVRVW